ncbi:hypothetical protein GDO86_015016 [Hymenochirus boettgeri]|nr:hypothetical protein GDO86_015016 [Hymenochirus boettgeri]
MTTLYRNSLKKLISPICMLITYSDVNIYCIQSHCHFNGLLLSHLQPFSRNLCKSCAVVSSSGQMLGSGLGTRIDQAECIIRMNTAPTLGYETDVGSRSTVRVVSHTSVPLLLRNQTYFFEQSQETVYVIWGPRRQMDLNSGITYRVLFHAKGKFPQVQIYTLTQDMMAYCDQVFQNETGKNRAMSGTFLSTGWFTMILAMELCEEIAVYGMVSENYCR